mmetsp:Transcript_33340/g.92131  ORF Transcript_33340/g.92131 Transcript_33340/m.92131 type:complete len:348 (+) Transcript_33340:815-1858(+)
MRIVRQGNREALDEGLTKSNERVELGHHSVVAIEVRQEKHMPALHEVHGREAAELDLVCARVWELLPPRREEAEACRSQRLQPASHVLEGWSCDDVVSLAIDEAAPCHWQAQIVKFRFAGCPGRADWALGVNVCAELRGGDGHAAAPGLGSHAPNDSRGDTEGLGDGDDRLRYTGLHVELQAVAHIKGAVHLPPGHLGMLMQELEERWHGQHPILDHVQALDEIQDARLPTTRAMNHTMDAPTQVALEDAAHHRCIGPCRGKQELAYGQPLAIHLHGVLQGQGAAVNLLLGPPGVEGLREVGHEGLRENVVPRAHQAGAADAAVVTPLVGGLPRGREAHHQVAFADA